MGRASGGPRQRGHGQSLQMLQMYALDRRRWDTRTQLRIAIVTSIEPSYSTSQLCTVYARNLIGKMGEGGKTLAANAAASFRVWRLEDTHPPTGLEAPAQRSGTRPPVTWWLPR